MDEKFYLGEIVSSFIQNNKFGEDFRELCNSLNILQPK